MYPMASNKTEAVSVCKSETHTHTPQPQHRSCVSFKVRIEIRINGEKVKRKTIVGESWNCVDGVS